jgi:hypothetical protein
MPSLGLRILTGTLMFAAVPHEAVAQAGRVGGGAAAAPAPAVAPPPAPAPVVPALPTPAAPMVHSFAPPTIGRALPPAAAGSIALPQVHAPSVGAAGVPHQTPAVSVPQGAAHVRSSITGRPSPAPLAPASAGPSVSGATAPASDHHARHHRRQGVNAGALWGTPGTCWMWLTRPGHRRLRFYRCS